jgi:hypothetical protein
VYTNKWPLTAVIAIAVIVTAVIAIAVIAAVTRVYGNEGSSI